MRRCNTAFTLVELLVVIVVICFLLAILILGVPPARESARETECANKLKNLSLGAVNFRSFHQTYPTGGWGTKWTGDPDRVGEKEQPGSWVYSILPYIEQPALYKLGEDGDAETVTADQRAKTAAAVTFPLDILHCPSRRLPELRPSVAAYHNADHTTKMTLKTDYAANGGTRFHDISPRTVTADTSQIDGPILVGDKYPDTKTFNWYPNGAEPNGVIYRHSALAPNLIRDRLASTLLFAEKALPVKYYEKSTSNRSTGDAYSAFNCGDDTIRFVGEGAEPINDKKVGTITPGPRVLPSNKRFGSAHTSGFNATFTDGHVKTLTFGMDKKVLSQLGHRADGKPIPKGEF